jgi:hypothetical protein
MVTVSEPTADLADPAGLCALVDRIARKDRSALADLRVAMGPTALEQACKTLSNPADLSAVLCATFEEIWWLARFHTSANTDVRAWIVDIVARRVADRARTDPGRDLAAGLGMVNDQSHRLMLMRLLDERTYLP